MATKVKSKRSAGKRKPSVKVSRTTAATKTAKKKIGRPGKEKVPTHPVLHKDHRYMTVDGTPVPKSRVALEVLNRFIEKKGIRTIDKLTEQFPVNLHPAGLIVPLGKARIKNAKRSRFYTNEVLTLGGKKFAVCKEFGHNNMTPLINAAEKHGIKIQRVSKKAVA